MNFLILIPVALIGAIMGSFLNAMALRWVTTRRSARRSKCFHCGTVLHSQNLVPIFSWVWQRGRCNKCYSRISARYPIVEITTAFLFAALYWQLGQLSLEFILSLIVISLLILIALIDLDTFTIPHELSLPLIAISFFALFIDFADWQIMQPTLWQILAGPILAAFFWIIWAASRGRAMGFADGTLSLFIGWWLGLLNGVGAVMLAFWIGSLVSVGIIAWQKYRSKHQSSDRLTMKSAVPFGPYLVAGTLIVWLFDIPVMSIFGF